MVSKHRFSGIFSFILLSLSIGVVIGCASTSTATPPARPTASATPLAGVDISGLTPETFFPRLKRAMTRPGFVFHTSSELSAYWYSDTISTEPVFTAETWLDTALGLGRTEFRKDPASEAEWADRAIVVGETLYIFSNSANPEQSKLQACPLTDLPPIPPVGMSDCESFPEVEVKEGKVETDVKYEGQPAVVLTFEQLHENETANEPFYKVTTSFYVDRGSFLPFAWVLEGKDDTGQLVLRVVLGYKNEFVELASLPADFFQPASLDEFERNLVAPLDDPNLGITVYWLGREFAPPGDLPPLSLSQAFKTESSRQGRSEKAALTYLERRQGHRSSIRIKLWQLQEWQRIQNHKRSSFGWWDTPCVQTKEVSLEGGRAIIFMGHEIHTPLPPREDGPTPTQIRECPTRPFDQFQAHVSLGDTLAVVDAPLADRYNTLEGMEAIVRGLMPRVAGE